MVNTELLKAHVAKYKFTKESVTEFHKQLFTLYPILAERWDAEDLDPDSLHKAQKFQRLGHGEIMHLFNIAGESADPEHGMVRAVSEVVDYYHDMEFPLEKFHCLGEALIKAMEIHAGGCSQEQAKEWTQLFEDAHQIMVDHKLY